MLPNYNMSTFDVFLSFFLVSFLYSQNYTPMALYEENFSLYIYILIHDKTFSVHALELFFFMSHSLYTNPIHVRRFFRFSQHTHVVHTKISLYTLVAHTHENFFPHIIYTHKNPSIHIFLLHTYIKKKPFFFFFIYVDILFTTLLSFYHDFGSFYFYFGRCS